MSWKFWKSDHEKFEEEMRKAFDNRNKNKIDKAVEEFLDAYNIASSSGDPSLREKGKIAYAYALVYKALLTKSPKDLTDASEYLKTLREDVELDLALPKPVKAHELAEELYIASLYYSTPRVDMSSASSLTLEDAKKIRSVGEYFLSKGSRRLLLEDLLDIKESLSIIGLKLLGYSRLIEAYHVEKEDLNRSIELYAEALAYFQQAADPLANPVKARISKLGKATKCWFCGRAVQGEEVNFVYLDSFLTKYIIEKYGSDAPDIIESSGKRVAACAGCYGAIHSLSEKIARYYYEEAMKALKALEERVIVAISQLQAQISMLQSRLAALESSVSSMRMSLGQRRGPF